LVHRGKKRPTTINTHPSFLEDQGLQLLAFGGKGGVGKTTCATAAALYLSDTSPKKTFLLLSTDPAHSVFDCLGSLKPRSNLTVEELNAPGFLDIFKKKHAEKLRLIASRGTFLDDEDINRFFELTLPGLDEIMAFLAVLERLNGNAYDTVVMDTAPTGHTLRLLEMPGFFEKWLEAMDSLLGKHRYMKKIFSGAYQPDDVDRFILDLSASIETMASFLRDARTYRFVPVMLAEKLSVDETSGLLDFLTGAGMPFREIIINRLVPENECPVCNRARARQIREINRIRERVMEASFWGIPLLAQEPIGSRLKEIFSQYAQPINFHLSPPADFSSLDPVPVEWFGERFDLRKRLLLFGGKGGVGKTTLSCATALYLAQSSLNRNVLLFSADPAHSLSSCLEMDVGSLPCRVVPGLTAVSIDGAREFETLKEQYRTELETFLVNVSENLDLTFDREVMERVMDLSPPGIDEVMALTSAVEFIRRGDYDFLVMDGAPSGHFIRLLEMPGVVDKWLKVFFNLFLKYRDIFRLPGISARLVKLSKDVKELRNMLGDSEKACVMAVSILTRMAFEETSDLLDACARLGIDVPVIFLNMGTPNSSCSLCSTRYHGELIIRDDFLEAWPDSAHALIYTRDEPRGIAQLTELGKAIYEP
jgi:arsenite/tail-anchored protein-transporting ATPase